MAVIVRETDTQASLWQNKDLASLGEYLDFGFK